MTHVYKDLHSVMPDLITFIVVGVNIVTNVVIYVDGSITLGRNSIPEDWHANLYIAIIFVGCMKHEVISRQLIRGLGRPTERISLAYKSSYFMDLLHEV